MRFAGLKDSTGLKPSYKIENCVAAISYTVISYNIATMSNLVIVESPAKCAKIQGFLGADFRVIASMGHIRALQEDLKAIGLERDFEPYYEWIKEKGRAIQGIRDAARGCRQVYLAADDDREGEAIAYSVCLLLGLPPETTPRAVFHEITKKAVCAAVAAPRRLDMNKIHAQQARAILDMMIGFTMSPLLWRHVASGLSAGRCQTPALRLLVEREDAIASFKAASSWSVTGQWRSGKNTIQGALEDEIEDEESVRNYLEILADIPNAVITDTAVKPWTSAPPQPFTTSALQQAASSHFKMSPKVTMSTAQKLYEGGYITYMRTDSTALAEDAVAEIKEYITEEYGAQYCGTGAGDAAAAEKKKKAKKAAVTAVPAAQEAHEAIRPTHIETGDLDGDEWTAAHKKLYGLIRTRTLQSQMAAARGEECRIVWVPCDEEGTVEEAIEDFKWTAAVRRTTFDGWRRLGRAENIVEDSSEDEAGTDAATDQWKWIVGLEEGDQLKWRTLQAEPKESRPPGRYMEATLVRELEKRGIGRPSTFAAIIASLTDKKYMEERDIPGREIKITSLQLKAGGALEESTKKKTVGAEKKKLVPTDLGRQTLAFLLREFADLFEYDFTAAMENRLDAVATGREVWKGVLRDTWTTYKERYDKLKGDISKRGGASSSSAKEFAEATGDLKGLKAIVTKKGPLLLVEDPTGDKKKTRFFGWPAAIQFADITYDDAITHINTAKNIGAAVCEHEGTPVYKKKGPYGWYIQCGDRRMKCGENDGEKEIIALLSGASTADDKKVLRKIGEYEVRQGPYGMYMFKPALKTKVFVKVAAGVDYAGWTVDDAKQYYAAGKSAAATAKQGALPATKKYGSTKKK